MSKVFRLSIIVLLGFLAIVSGLQSLSVQSNRFTDIVKNYPADGNFFSLAELKEENNPAVEAKLYEYADKYKAVIIHRADFLSSIDESIEGYKFGFYGDVKEHAESMLLEYNKTSVLNAENLQHLLSSSPEKTLGLNTNRADMLEDLPSVAFSTRIIGMHLPKLIADSGTIRGDYKIVGLSRDQFNTFITELSTLSGIDEALLRRPLSGSNVTYSILDGYSLAALLALIIFIGIVVFLATFLTIRQYGIYAMLGWSKWTYIVKLFSPFMFTSLIFTIIPAGVILWSFHNFPFNSHLAITAFSAMLKFLFFSALAFCPALIALLLIKPVKAIRNQVSQHSLLFLSILLLVLSSAGATGALRAIDGPLITLQENKKVQEQWEKYADLNILHHESVGNNNASFTGGQSSEHFREVYSWYQAIENQPGVYLANTSFYSSKILEIWQNVYKTVPEKPFWYFQASSSYLDKIGFTISEEDIELADSGTRIYYIPNTYTQSERDALSGWVKESVLKDRGDSIVTPFMKNPVIEFREYSPGELFFTWNTDPLNDFFTSDPVIYLADTANMTPFESESLSAIGLEESYIKLSSDNVQKYTAQPFLARYHLEDNAPVFLPVSDFISGLHKSMSTFIQLFGGAALFIIFLNIALIFILVSLYAQIYSQQIAVKRLLGYPLRKIFAAPFVLVATVSASCVLASFLLESRTGLVIMTVFMMIQLTLLVWQAGRLTTQQISTNVKEQ